jgi:hypothetical protein
VARALGDPLAQDLLELVDEVVREVFGVLAAAVDVGAFVAGQGCEEVFADRAKDPFDRRLVLRCRLRLIGRVRRELFV